MRKILKFSILIGLALVSCNKSSKFPVYNPEFVKHISAYTTGVVYRNSSIQIILAEPVTDKKRENTEPNQLLDFSPSIKGKATWVDNRTIKFEPETELSRGTVFQGVFYLGKVQQVKRELKKFPFRFETRQQVLQLNLKGLVTYPDNNPKYRLLIGSVSTNDLEDQELIAETMKATIGNKTLPIKWIGNTSQKFQFKIDSIERNESDKKMLIQIDGKPVESESKETRIVNVPGMGVFGLENIEVTHEPDQKVEMYFSENLNSLQSLAGLILLDSNSIENYELSGNKITIYPEERISGDHEIYCSADIKNYAGYRLKKAQTRTVFFEKAKPKLKMIGKGSIVPNAKGVVFPFEAMGLKAVDLWIYRIYEKNIPQFLQVNDLDGNNQLSRVGKLIHSGKVDLSENKKPLESEWTRYTLNLSKYINQEPGAIYRVLIGFRSSYTFFECPETNTDYSLDEDGMYYNYYNGDNDNLVGSTPCDSRFYYSGSLCRNILSSDVGLIVKRGKDDKTHVFASSLINARPLTNIKLEFFTYQNQRISSTYTDQEGMATVKLTDEAYVVVASSGNQKGYLKLGNGRNNSTSKFDVGGVNGASSIDGMIYTERGVWRPGDSIYTCFTLQDRENKLPSNVPVTFELINPQGQIVSSRVRSKAVGDVYDFRTTTEVQWATGNYTARVTVGGSTFYKTLAVETVKPNRLKILLNVKDSSLSPNNQNVVTLDGKWLHGAPAPNLRYNVKGKIRPVKTVFKGYNSFNFQDQTKKTETRELVLSEGVLDEKGSVTFNPEFALNDEVEGSLKVDLIAKIFEKGGNFSQDYGTFPIQAYSSYVGIQPPTGNEQDNSLETDLKHTFTLVNLTSDGEPLSGKKLEVKVYKIDWNWWWDNHQNLATYMQSSSLFPVLDTIVMTDKDGFGKTKFRLPYPNWGRFIMVVKDPISKHRSTETFYVDWPYWKRGNRNKTEQAKTIVLTSNKKKYGVNEKVQVTIPSSDYGRALVCIENGSSVLKKFWIDGSKGETKFSFITTNKMTPNVYVHVSYLQTYNDKENDLPARLYGILPILVEDKSTHIYPELLVKDEIRPDRHELVRVKESSGRPMTYTLAVVDEGLLDLTHFKTPTLWHHFYQKQGLGVRTWDLYDEVMGGYAGKYGNVLSVGGDEEGNRDESVHKANRFKPAVKFYGPFTLKPGQVGKHIVEMGAYVGAVRMMVIARQGNSYGEVSKSVKVKKPLMILPTMPRVISPGELVDIPVTVFSLVDAKTDVSVSIKTTSNIEIIGDKTKEVHFVKQGDKTIYFKAKVAEAISVAKITTTAKSGAEIASKEVEIAIRTPNPKITTVKDVMVQKGGSITSEVLLDGLDGTNECAIEVSALPPLNLHSRLDELLRYPHGCVEQTTSSVFAQLFVGEILTLNEDQQFSASQNIQAAIQRLRLFQTSSGGLGYWPGSTTPNEWGTNYAGHFLLLAQNKGYKVDKQFLKKWINYQEKEAKNHSSSAWHSDLIQAYRLYTLVLAGKPDLASMNRMRERQNVSNMAKWRLAAAYAKAGMPEVSNSIIDKLEFDMHPYANGHGYTYGSQLRDKAMILETLTLLGEESQSLDLMKQVAERLASNSWLSTQETAYSLIAISDIYKKNKGGNGLKFELTQSGKVNTINTGKALYQKVLIQHANQKKLAVKIKNTNDGVLFVRIIKTGVPAQTDTVKKSSNLKLFVRYVDYNGVKIDPTKLEQGKEFKAVISVQSGARKGSLQDMALSFMVPVGWEIENSRLLGTESGSFVYRDYRDDRVYTYFNMGASQTRTYEFKLTATYSGKFFQPTITASSMYDNSIIATEPGGWVEVTEPEVKNQ